MSIWRLFLHFLARHLARGATSTSPLTANKGAPGPVQGATRGLTFGPNEAPATSGGSSSACGKGEHSRGWGGWGVEGGWGGLGLPAQEILSLRNDWLKATEPPTSHFDNTAEY